MKLHVAKDLALPIEAVTESIAMLGRKGSGKSYLAHKLAEEMHRVHAQFVGLDPVGIWYGLRLAADGKSPGLAIPVFGGLHGDIPLEPTAGAVVANMVVDRGISVILDVSQFESDADKARFAKAFADRFFFRKKASPSAVHVFIEECQEFVPQNPQREEAQMLHAFTRMAKIGRNFGIGISLISQRPQEVNKKVLNLTELLFAFQLTGPQERKTVQGWIAEKGIDEDIAGELPKLERGAPHVWSPAWLKISRVVSVERKHTFDASSTPKVGRQAAARHLSPIDLAQLSADMAATIEKAKAEDPKLLRAENAKLKADLAKRPTVVNNVARAPSKTTLVEAEKRGYERARKAFAVQMRKASDAIGAAAASISKAVSRETTALASLQLKLAGLSDEAAVELTGPRAERFVAISRELVRKSTVKRTDRDHNGEPLPPGEHAVLTAIAQHQTVDRDQLSVLTGYKRSTRDAYIARLREKGFLDANGTGITATEHGIAALGPDWQPLPTGAALLEHWRGRLPEGERKTLDVLVAKYPDAVPREQIDEPTGFKRSTRDAYLGRLRARRLVEFTGRGEVRASAGLF